MLRPYGKKYPMRQYTMPDYAALQAPYAPLLRAALAAATPGGARLALDLACGSGAHRSWLSAVCAPDVLIVGLDHDQAALAAAGPGRWLTADVQRLPMRPAVADLAWCVAALSLFAAPALALAEARRVLRPGGALVVTVAGERWVRPRHWPPSAAPIQSLNPPPPADGLGDELRLALATAGFRTSTLAAYMLDPPGLDRQVALLPLADLAPLDPLAIGEPEPHAVLLVATAYT